MPSAEVRIVPNSTELSHEAAEMFVYFGQQAIGTNGTFRVALSGGSTPKALYQALTSQKFASQMDWPRVDFFFGDDRCVPPDHPESNYGLANQWLFRPLKIRSEMVFRMEGEAESNDVAARRYEEVLRMRFSTPPPAIPRFHLIMLGLGDDGHTASLFPGTAALDEKARLVMPSQSPKGIPQRITFTAPLINEAEAVLFVVDGAGKAGPIKGILEAPENTVTPFPGSLVRPKAGRLVWLLDRDAASELKLARQQVESHEE